MRAAKIRSQESRAPGRAAADGEHAGVASFVPPRRGTENRRARQQRAPDIRKKSAATRTAILTGKNPCVPCRRRPPGTASPSPRLAPSTTDQDSTQPARVQLNPSPRAKPWCSRPSARGDQVPEATRCPNWPRSPRSIHRLDPTPPPAQPDRRRPQQPSPAEQISPAPGAIRVPRRPRPSSRLQLPRRKREVDGTASVAWISAPHDAPRSGRAASPISLPPHPESRRESRSHNAESRQREDPADADRAPQCAFIAQMTCGTVLHCADQCPLGRAGTFADGMKGMNKLSDGH